MNATLIAELVETRKERDQWKRCADDLSVSVAHARKQADEARAEGEGFRLSCRQAWAETDTMSAEMKRRGEIAVAELTKADATIKALTAERDALRAALNESLEWHRELGVGSGYDSMVKAAQKSKLKKLTAARHPLGTHADV